MSTSKLQQKVSKELSKYFVQFTIRENTRPSWLVADDSAPLEFDFYIEELNIAIEVQGEQHYRYVEFMHGDYNGWIKRQKYDDAKREICKNRGIKFIEISEENEIDLAISEMLIEAKDNDAPSQIERPMRLRPVGKKRVATRTLDKRSSLLYAMKKNVFTIHKMMLSENPDMIIIERRMSVVKKIANKYNIPINTSYFLDKQ